MKQKRQKKSREKKKEEKSKLAAPTAAQKLLSDLLEYRFCIPRIIVGFVFPLPNSPVVIYDVF